MGQIHNGLALAAGHGLKPECAVVAMRTCGGPTTTAASTSRSSARSLIRCSSSATPAITVVNDEKKTRRAVRFVEK